MCQPSYILTFKQKILIEIFIIYTKQESVKYAGGDYLRQ